MNHFWNSVKTNLNAGIGDPCAGHKSANFEWALPIKALILSLTLNLGAALPIGSKNASSKIFQFFDDDADVTLA